MCFEQLRDARQSVGESLITHCGAGTVQSRKARMLHEEESAKRRVETVVHGFEDGSPRRSLDDPDVVLSIEVNSSLVVFKRQC